MEIVREKPGLGPLRGLKAQQVQSGLKAQRIQSGLKAQRVQVGCKPSESVAQSNALGAMFPFPTPCKGKSKNQAFAHIFALTGRRRLYIDTQGVALGWGLDALSGRSRRRFELIEFLQRGCGLRRSSLVGLRRRNNELNELTNCRAARVRDVGASYSIFLQR